MAKFVVNNKKFALSKLSLFFIGKSIHSRISFDVIDFLDIIIYK